MDVRNPLGSVAALSLAADPASLITAAVISGVAVTVSAAVFTYHAYKTYEEKKHRAEIEFINHLHLKHLSRIYISDYNEIQGFPPIFKLSKDPNSAAAESMHLTDEQIDDIGKTLPHSTDVILSYYRESIVYAIRKLKDYYFSRDERNDITAGVISYLLYMLNTKCLNFQGYDYDIAYLKAITNFITAFASIKERSHSQEFSRLNPVFSYLTTATQILEKHKESLSLEEMVGELRDACISKSSQLIQCLAKLISKDKHWRLIDFVGIDELANGIIRQEFIKKEIGGFVLSKHHSKTIRPSGFSDWLITLASYYTKVINPEIKIDRKELLAPSIQFVLPSKERYLALKSKKELSKAEALEFEEIKKKIKQMIKLYEEAPNFISTKLDPKTKNKLPKMIPVDDPETALDRAYAIQSFSSLIHQVLSLQYLSTQLLKSTKQLGELYVKNPNHFCRIFYVLESLSNQVKNGINDFRKKLTAIHRLDMNTMQLERQEILPDQVDTILSTTYASISVLSSRIKDYRNRVAKNLNANEPTIESVKMEMFEVANMLASIYEMDNTENHPALIKEPDVSSIVLPDPVNTDKHLVYGMDSGEGVDNGAHVIEAKAQPEVKIQPVVKLQPEIKIQPEAKIRVDVDKPITSLDLISQIDQQETVIANKFSSLPVNNETKLMTMFISALGELKNKAHTLLNNSGQSSERQAKVLVMLMLIKQLLVKSSDFIYLNPEERMASIHEFVTAINKLIGEASHQQLIDQHSNPVTKWFYEMSGCGIFATDSRKKLNQFKESVQQMESQYSSSVI